MTGVEIVKKFLKAEQRLQWFTSVQRMEKNGLEFKAPGKAKSLEVDDLNEDFPMKKRWITSCVKTHDGKDFKKSRR